MATLQYWVESTGDSDRGATLQAKLRYLSRKTVTAMAGQRNRCRQNLQLYDENLMRKATDRELF